MRNTATLSILKEGDLVEVMIHGSGLQKGLYISHTIDTFAFSANNKVHVNELARISSVTSLTHMWVNDGKSWHRFER